MFTKIKAYLLRKYILGFYALEKLTVKYQAEALHYTGATDLWVLQDKRFGLGNFIELTPALQSLSTSLAKRIPVYFESYIAKQCFIDCTFIQILLNKPKNPPLFKHGLINYHNSCSDAEFAYKVLSKRFPLLPEIPHTYVDQAKEISHTRKRPYTLFLRGSGSDNPNYLLKNTPNDRYYKEYINDYNDYIFTGSEEDLKRAGDLFNPSKAVVGNIRISLALIRDAEQIISNDTGLAHAAGAMNKELLILWKNNKLPKSSNPGRNTLIRMCKELTNK